MNSAKISGIFLGSIILLGLACVFFMPKSDSLSVTQHPALCDPAKADCSKVTPTGEPFVRPPEPVPEPEQVGQIDEHLFVNSTLREVVFCGKSYQVKQLVIDGVDVVQRVAELAKENKKIKEYPQYKGAREICNEIQKTYREQSPLKLDSHLGKVEGGKFVYFLNIAGSTSFIISLNTNSISEEVSGPEFPDPGLFGVFIPIGSLK